MSRGPAHEGENLQGRDESEEEFRKFFEAHYSRVVTTLMSSRRASKPDTEDAVIVAMAKASQEWTRLENPSAWVYRVAFNELHRIRTKRVPEPVEDVEAATPATTPFESTIDTDMLFIELIRQLPEEQRKVAALYYDDHGTKEISEILGKTEPTVRSLLRAARKSLRALHRRVEEPPP